MKMNIIIICFLTIVLIIAITCTGNIKVSLENAVIFDYPVPDGMITDGTEKESMIKAKIKQLEEINSVYWGEFPAEKKRLIEVMEIIFKEINKKFPGFKGLDLDWNKFENETIEKTKKVTNYGDFLSLLTKITFNLKEGHTRTYTDRLKGIVKNSDAPELYPDFDLFRKNVPIFFASIDITRIGACYVITEKEELVITRAIKENNPYNLKQGDEIIGFNGVAWKEWYPHLLEANIPIYGSAGASEGARKYILLKSGVANANLFEKINIKRYDTGEIEALNITFIEIPKKKAGYLGNYSDNYACTDYISDIPNIETPKNFGWYQEREQNQEGTNVSFKDILNSGIIEGTNIGYIYLTKFFFFENGEFGSSNTRDPYKTKFAEIFEKTVLDLLYTDGLIIDVRKNSGGLEDVVYKGLSHLIKSDRDIKIFELAKKGNDIESLIKKEIKGRDFPLKADNPDLYYEKPIIILTGPDCISACDVFIALASKFPEFTIIGNHNNGSFAGINLREDELSPKLRKEDRVSFIMPGTTILYADDENPYLLRRSDFIDEFVLPTKDDIANGIDTVRERAIEIIQNVNRVG